MTKRLLQAWIVLLLAGCGESEELRNFGTRVAVDAGREQASSVRGSGGASSTGGAVGAGGSVGTGGAGTGGLTGSGGAPGAGGSTVGTGGTTSASGTGGAGGASASFPATTTWPTCAGNIGSPASTGQHLCGISADYHPLFDCAVFVAGFTQGNCRFVDPNNTYGTVDPHVYGCADAATCAAACHTNCAAATGQQP